MEHIFLARKPMTNLSQKSDIHPLNWTVEEVIDSPEVGEP